MKSSRRKIHARLSQQKMVGALCLWSGLLGLCAACNSQDTTSMKTFEWTPTNTAPENYPVYLYRGLFMGTDSSIISTPDRQTLYYGWQNDGAVYISGPDLKPAPQELKLLWLSYAEQKYYGATIDLPVDKIEALFEEGFVNANTRRHATYSTISYGIAPGGFVVVWLIGAGHWVEVTTGRGEVTQMAFEEMIPSTNLTQQEYTDMVLKDEVEDSVLAEIRRGKIPYGRWEKTYRTKYRWSAQMAHAAEDFTPLSAEIQMYNGEQDVEFFDMTGSETAPRKAVPMYFRLEWRDAKDNLFASQITFNEQEIYDAFETFSKQTGGQPLQVVAQISRYNDEITLALRTGEEEIPLPKTEVKIFAKDE